MDPDRAVPIWTVWPGSTKFDHEVSEASCISVSAVSLRSQLIGISFDLFFSCNMCHFRSWKLDMKVACPLLSATHVHLHYWLMWMCSQTLWTRIELFLLELSDLGLHSLTMRYLKHFSGRLGKMTYVDVVCSYSVAQPYSDLSWNLFISNFTQIHLRAISWGDWSECWNFGMIQINYRTRVTKALIGLGWCTGWSASSL